MRKRLVSLLLFCASLPSGASASAIASCTADHFLNLRVNLVFFTVEGKPRNRPALLQDLATQIDEQIQALWGPPLLEAGIRLHLSHETVTAAQALRRARRHPDFAENFVVLTDHPAFSSSAALCGGGNIAIFRPSDLVRHPTVFGHEFGHLLGLDHPPREVVQDQPDMMLPAPAVVSSPELGLQPRGNCGGIPCYRLNEAKRAVLPATIQKLRSRIHLRCDTAAPQRLLPEPIGTQIRSLEDIGLYPAGFPELTEWLKGLFEWK
jgi:hypothetical protein